MGEKGNLGEAAAAVGEHGETTAGRASELATKVSGELAAGMVVGAAGEKLEERSKRRKAEKPGDQPTDSDS